MALSSPLHFIENDLTKNLMLVVDNFTSIFLKSNNRPEFNKKFIYFEMNSTNGAFKLPYPEKLMHIMSLEPSHNHTSFPCNNDISFTHCQNQCNINFSSIYFSSLQRNECYYRMARIHWIPEIIQLANLNNPSVQTWIEKGLDKRGKQYEKTYIRYQEGIVDYVIILRNVLNSNRSLKHYYFISAFPVFLKRNKDQFSAQYSSFINSLPTSP